MTKLESKKLAKKIATELFTPYGEKMGDKLRIMRGDSYLAGWAFEPAVAAILKVIEENDKT